MLRPLLALLVGAPVAFAQENVLLIVADDVGVDYVGAYAEGPNPATTPNIDALAQRGVLFRNAWAAPICSATRAQIMTGRHGYRTGIGHVVTGDFALSLDEFTLPEALDCHPELGIAQAAFGKWHLGNANVGGALSPNKAGWSHFAGSRANLVPPDEDYVSWLRVEDGVEAWTTDYSTTRIVDDFLAWHATVKSPWFAYVAFHGAHEPLHAPPAHLHTVDLPDVDEIREAPVPYYRAMVEAVDTELGRLFASLGPELDRTHVLFLGDNGTNGTVSVAPFLPKHAKMTPYEGGLNVPLIIAGPAVRGPGREVPDLVEATDLYDTSLQLIGVPLDGSCAEPPRDGISLVRILAQPTAARPPLRSIAYEEYFAPSGFGPYGKDLRMARDPRYKLIHDRLHGKDELYDLLVDPFETKDLLLGPLTLVQEGHYRSLREHIAQRAGL